MQPSTLLAANFSVGPWNRSTVHQLQKEHREICVCVRISLNKFVFHFTSSAFILRYELSPIDVCASFAWVKANSDKLCFIPFSIAGSISGGCRAHAVYSWAMSRRKVRSSCRWWGGMLWMGCHAVERAICFLFADTSCSASRRRREASRLQHLCFSWLILDEQTRHHHHPHHPGPRACSGTNAGRNKGTFVLGQVPQAHCSPIPSGSKHRTSQGKGLSRWHIPGTGFVRKSEILRSNL